MVNEMREQVQTYLDVRKTELANKAKGTELFDEYLTVMSPLVVVISIVFVTIFSIFPLALLPFLLNRKSSSKDSNIPAGG